MVIDELQFKSAILVIDDNAANLKLLTKTLTAAGYCNIQTLQDPREAAERYRELSPDLVLLDLNMPYLDGYGVMADFDKVHMKLPPPVIIITAQQSQEFTLKALQAGARDYITKPFDRSELLMRVNNVLGAHLAHKMVQNQNVLLEEMVKDRTKKLQDTRLQVVQRLGMAAEYRDEETGNHILRMSHCCALLAEKLGWSETQCQLILHASPMHDIGKIGIPDDILLKPGKFEPEEWRIMQTHAEIGAKLLEGDDSDLMQMARDIAFNHHEKWDGSGYPRGLQGEDIPLSGRIAAVADVFDALTSVRPYKKAWEIEDAVALIKSGSGQHFDPRVVEVFLENLDAILDIRKRFQD